MHNQFCNLCETTRYEIPVSNIIAMAGVITICHSSCPIRRISLTICYTNTRVCNAPVSVFMSCASTTDDDTNEWEAPESNKSIA